MFLLTYELIALSVLVRLLAVPMLCSLHMSIRIFFSVMVGSVLTLLLVTTAVNAHALFTVSAHARALTLGVNARVRALAGKSACALTAVVTSNKASTEPTITENSVRRLIRRLHSIGTASSCTRTIRAISS